MKALNNFRDKDYIETEEGFLFCVIGSIHPADRAIAYLKYISDSQGKWNRGQKSFKRVMDQYSVENLEETIKVLEKHPEYLYESSEWDTKISAVPDKKISKHFRPDEKLRCLFDKKDLDSLQRKCLDIVEFLSANSEISLDSFGVTGSILLDMHQSFSDIDIVVYGSQESRIVKKTLLQSFEDESLLNRLGSKYVENWCKRKAESYPVSYEEARFFNERRWDRGIYKDKEFSILPVKKCSEVSEDYGDRVFKTEGTIKIEATISNASESLFLPSVYHLKNVNVDKGKKLDDIRTVVSYDWFYSDIAREGEKVKARGKLEKVRDTRTGERYHRVLIGSFTLEGKGYIKPLVE